MVLDVCCCPTSVRTKYRAVHLLYKGSDYHKCVLEAQQFQSVESFPQMWQEVENSCHRLLSCKMNNTFRRRKWKTDSLWAIWSTYLHGAKCRFQFVVQTFGYMSNFLIVQKLLLCNVKSRNNSSHTATICRTKGQKKILSKTSNSLQSYATLVSFYADCFSFKNMFAIYWCMHASVGKVPYILCSVLIKEKYICIYIEIWYRHVCVV